MEKEIEERQKFIAEREEELNELRKKVSTFPKELETAVNKAVKETTDRFNLEAKIERNCLKRNILASAMY